MNTKADKKAQFKNLVKRIQRSNKKFEAATPAQKIVMVAQDVLALLDLNRIKAEQGIYVRVPQVEKVKVNEDGKCSMQDVFKMPDLPACHVCAIGSAQVAAVLRLNRVEAPADEVRDGKWYSYNSDTHYDSDDQISERAREVFPGLLLRDMERAFEHGSYDYYQVKTPKARLRAIYQNLIDNKGCFTYYKDSQVIIHNSAVL
jgi:hypothetical protein